jgi:TolB protein
MGDDWLYTGRAIAIDNTPIGAGWLVVVREDFGGETYWRVYLRPIYQDGSAGVPLHDLPWDFDSRYNGDTDIYEQGGVTYGSTPAGYWIDFTERVQAYGWERLPALNTWRASHPAARFNEFLSAVTLTGNQPCWEIYPPEALITPSPVVPPRAHPRRPHAGMSHRHLPHTNSRPSPGSIHASLDQRTLRRLT